jgi:hypothetical protein
LANPEFAMIATVEEITAAELSLPPEEKARLLDRVAASIAVELDPRIKRMQLDEVRQRRAQVLSGQAHGVASQQVRDEIAALLK